MNIKPKKLFAVLLVLCLIISTAPLTANAAQNTWDPSNNVYDISTEADLLAFRDSLNNGNDFSGKTVSLLNDLDFNGVDYACPVEAAMFSGNFDGKGHTISNINMVSADDSVVGLLPVLNGSVTVKDLTISNVTIENGKDTTGVFCAYSYQCDVSFENCHLTGNSTIIANKSRFKYCSVFVPLSYYGNVLMTNCSVGEDVSIMGTGDADSAVAPFVAFAHDISESGVNIIDCINKADVSTNSGPVGGLVGQTNDYVVLYINRCANYGNVVSNQTKASDPCGGLVGYASSSFIVNSLNAGNVTSNSTTATGGIVGQLRINDNTRPYQGDIDTGIITYPEAHNLVYNCYNTGNVSTTSTPYIGGIVGMMQEHSSQAGNTLVENVYNFGSVSAVSSNVCLGTIVGDTDAVIEDVYAQNGTKAIQSLHKSDGTASSYTCKIGYYNTANKGGKVFPTDVVSGTVGPSGKVSVLETKSNTPLDTDLKDTLDKYVDEQNDELKENSNSFRYLPWIYSDGTDVHPVFGYSVINNDPESEKAANGGYLEVSKESFEYFEYLGETSKTVTVTVHSNAGKSLKSISAVDEDGNTVTLTNTSTGVYTFTMPQSDVTIDAVWESAGEPKNTVYLTTKDSVDITFVLDADYYTNDPDATVKLKYNHNNITYTPNVQEKTVKLSALERTADGRYKYTIESAPAQLTEEIEIKLYDTSSDDPLYDGEYSMWDYCDDVINNSIKIAETDMSDEVKQYWKKASEVCKALTDYATVAQKYFNYNMGDMASKNVEKRQQVYYTDSIINKPYYHDVDIVSLSTLAGKSGNKPVARISGTLPFEITETSLMSLANTEVLFYYEDDINENEYTLSVTADEWYGGDGPQVEFATHTNKDTGEVTKYIRVYGIESANLDNPFRLTISGGGSSATIEYNAIAYCYTVLRDTASSGDEKVQQLRQLVKSIYLYNQFAEDYFGSLS